MWKRVAGFVALALLVWAAAGFFSAQSACAHDPRFTCSPRENAHPVNVPDATKSWAYYGRLKPGTSDRYEFELKAPSSVPVNLLVDERDSANASRPSLSVERDGTGIARIDFSRSARFYEPFSRESYVQTPERTLDLTPGRYVAVISMSGDAPQRYTFAIGAAERFSVWEIPYVFGAIHRIRTLNY